MRSITLIIFTSLFFSVIVFSQDQGTMNKEVVLLGTVEPKKFVRYEELPNYCHSITQEMIQCFLKAKKVSDLSSQMDISPFFSGIEELEKKVDDNFSKMKPNDYYMLCSAYQISWGIVKRIQLQDKDNKDYRERVVQQFKRSLAKQGAHYLSMVTLLWFDIASPEEFSQLKAFAWNYIEKSDDLLILESFCNMLQRTDPHTKKLFGNAEDVKKLATLNHHIDMTTASGQRAIQITNHTSNVIECYLDPTRLSDTSGLSTFVLQVTHAEVEELGPIIFLDEKTIKEREEAKAKRSRMIQEEPEKATNLAKQLVGDANGRLKMLKMIGDIQESDVMRKAMKDTLSFYYFDKKNAQGETYEEKASLDEVQKIRELLKSENQKLKSDALDLIRSARCVHLIPDLFEICYNKRVPPYLGFGFGSVDPKTKKPIRFQYSPTQIISYLGNEKIIPELEKLSNSVTVSETMKRDAQLAIDVIKQKVQYEKEQIASQEKEKRLVTEGKLIIVRSGDRTDVKMNPFYDPTEKLVDLSDSQERPPNSRTWTSLEGWHSCNAVLNRKKDDHIILIRDTDKKEIIVPIKRLSVQDQEYIKNWIPPKK
ncbi:MAG: hypothetical protein LBE13_06390 [Bacteroidales bacterium]|jgi:hypothetical protein|nr:hypothetical protein [Bacteroidales bacterium]